jgi:hypothetical protein
LSDPIVLTKGRSGTVRDEDWMMAGDGNMNTHQATYGSVIGMLKWGTLGCVIIAALVIWLIA